VEATFGLVEIAANRDNAARAESNVDQGGSMVPVRLGNLTVERGNNGYQIL
jgi:hypothetical protein